MIEQIKPLKIGLIAYNRVQSELAIKDFIKNNEDQIDSFTKNKVMLKDGTTIHVLNDMNDLRGYRLDQLMLCDDYRWDINYHRDSFIMAALQLAIYPRSCVPNDFIIMEYEY